MCKSAHENRQRLGVKLHQAAWGVATMLLFALVSLPGCRNSFAWGQTMNLTSTSFEDGSQIPARYACSGEGLSPQLSWSPPPARTASLALIVTDPDAPRGVFTHWVLYDLPTNTRSLTEGVPDVAQLWDGALQGRNDFGNIGYGAPCPPPGSPHHYIFTLYALDVKLHLPAGDKRAQVEAAMQGHILAKCRLVGLFQR
jgi:Raf kinase inhibitor-like YbhB/YbcL family protein